MLAFNSHSQNSLGLESYWGIKKSPAVVMNFENNPGNFSAVKDWNFSLSYGSEFSKQAAYNLYSFSVSKRTGSHFLSARYTPGYQKEFIFSNGATIIFSDSTSKSLESHFSYKELFGAGYSYKFSHSFSTGFTIRYFTEEFNHETFQPVIEDTISYLDRVSDVEKINFWKADIGLTFNLSDNLSFTAGSINLLNFGEKASEILNNDYDLKRNKGALIGLSYNPLNDIDLNFLFETSESFQAGINKYFNFLDGKLGTTVTAFHDKYQKPFIAGIIPSISYSSSVLTVSLSGIKYFSGRNSAHTFSEFKENGINSIINNRYSYDKLVLNFSFSLNTLREKRVEFLGVEINKNIYPALSDYYIYFPFAEGKVVNISDKPVTVKPFSKVEGINEEVIQSPEVKIQPKDTAVVPFYIIIPEDFQKEKAAVSYADFYIYSEPDEPDDNFQKPVLVNNKNAWDGKVANLKYFIKKDIEFSVGYSKSTLSRHKSELDTIPYMLSPFYKARIIFSSFIKELTYISDPRASEEYVQYPNETLKLKGGDCDDLSVCYSSLLESVGVQTALVDYKTSNDERHVNVLINTELSPEQSGLITGNDNKYFIRRNPEGKDEIWIPVETTSLTGFDKAWQIGSLKFNKEAIENLGIATGNAVIIDIY